MDYFRVHRDEKDKLDKNDRRSPSAGIKKYIMNTIDRRMTMVKPDSNDDVNRTSSQKHIMGLLGTTMHGQMIKTFSDDKNHHE